MSPQITISSPDYVNPNTNFDLTITVQQADSPLSNMNVELSVQGAEIQNMDSVTNENGIATISLFSQDPTKVDVQVSVSGGLYPSSVVSKQINVNAPLESAGSNSSLPMLNIGVNPIFIIIPVAAAVGGIIVLKKKNMLTGLTEKISVIEKINEVKERISHLREK